VSERAKLRAALLAVVAFGIIMATAVCVNLTNKVHAEHVEQQRLAWCSGAVTPDELASCVQSFEDERG
jgi:hypothetical protein